MYEEHGRKWAFAFGYANIRKLVFVVTIGHADISVRWFNCENVFALHRKEVYREFMISNLCFEFRI